MSLSLNKIKVIKVVDPMLNFNEENIYAILKGGDRVSWKPIISTSYSNSSATFSSPPPSPKISVNRHVKLFQPVTIDYIGNCELGQLLLQSQYTSPRAYPLSTNMNTLQIDLNNTSFSINMSDTIQALLRYHNPDSLSDGNMSTTPSQMDNTQQYSDSTNSNFNPMSSVLDSSLSQGSMGRGAFPLVSQVNNISTGIGNPTTAQQVYNFCEDLFLSPLLFGTESQESGFIGLQTFQLTINWLNDLSRMISHNPALTTFTSITVTLGQPVLLFQYKTPNLMDKLPLYKNYPYYEIQRYPTDANAAILPGSSVILSSSNIQLNSIPRMLYIYARKRNSDLTYLDSDAFFSIEKISVNWANNSGLLSNATKRDLYAMSKKNGCNLNWNEWSGETTYFNSGGTVQQINLIGSVLAIEFSTDLAVAVDECSGLNGTFQLQYTITLVNRSSSSITPTLYTVVSNEGVFTIENNSAYSQIGVVSRQDVLNAQKQQGIDYNHLKYMSGASFFKSLSKGLKKIYKKAVPVVKKATKITKTIAPYIKEIKKISELMGVGYDEAEEIYDQYKRKGKGGAYVGGSSARGKKKKKSKKGGILIGGKYVSKEDLERSLYM